jgi:hypothetical protein
MLARCQTFCNLPPPPSLGLNTHAPCPTPCTTTYICPICPPPQITCAKDLVLYCEALRQNRQYVPANSFTYKHPALTFPDALPDELVAEPWVATPQLLLKDGSWQVDQWPDESLPYVEASVGLLGNRGEVEPLAMSFVTRWVASWPHGWGGCTLIMHFYAL